MKRALLFAAALLAATPATPALAWGNTGHRIVGVLAMRALPAGLPAFLRAPQAAADAGELSREPDRSKQAGRVHDSDRDPGHFLDLGDDGTVFGGPSLKALPGTRADYEKALQAVGQNSWNAGYLPYSIIASYQQLTKDFAFWRVLDAAERNPAWAVRRAWFRADKRRREAQILQDIGALSHFVGDGSQPLHVTIHYNGWGDFPNPDGYATAKLHGPFEGDLVRASVSQAAVAARMTPPRRCDRGVEHCVADYLAATGALVIPFYQLEKAGGLSPGNPRGPALATQQLAVAASELRDLIDDAWSASLRQTVGWNPIPVTEVLAGRVDPYAALRGVD